MTACLLFGYKSSDLFAPDVVLLIILRKHLQIAQRMHNFKDSHLPIVVDHFWSEGCKF